MRNIPEFEMGYIVQGNGDPVHDSAVAYSGGSDERELRLEGEDASGLMPRIVVALNAHDEMTAALRCIVAAMEAMGMAEMPRPDACPVTSSALRDLLAKAEAA